MQTITVDGTDYPIATFDTWTIDEAIVLWDYSKLNLNEIQDAGFHPGVVGALIHVSIARQNPDAKATSIRRLVGGLRIADLEQVFEKISEEVDALPPASNGAEPSSTERSGPTSNDISDQ